MLRRANSKSSNRLSRRKSTSSIPTKRDYIDPEVARRQAHAAATCAFARANERGKVEIGRSGGISGNKDVPNQRQLPDQYNEADQRDRGLRRQQSVRFTGPEAIPKRLLRRQSMGIGAPKGAVETKPAVSSLRPRALTNDVHVPIAYRPPSRSSSIGKASIGKGTAQSIVTALAAYDEYYARDDDVASTPSSYRRMRKSKSTRTLSYLSNGAKTSSNDVATSNDYNTRIWNRVPWIQSQEHGAALRAPKSMSFLRGGRDHMTPGVREDHDNAVQMARDNFLHQIEQQRLREQPSFLFRAKAKKEEKPFRQSVRSGSTNSYGLGVGSANQTIQPEEGSLRIKVRKVSHTIKKKLKELFRRSANQLEGAKIPDQQVEARASHRNSSYVSIPKARQEEYFDIPHPESTTISRVGSRLPSLHSVSSSQQLKSRNGSVHSQRSDGSGKSRATSWTSTVDNTNMSRQAQAEREAQRLSIIQENGTHISSASVARLGASNQFSAYPLLSRPRSVQRRGDQHAGPVDSQRVYSALMKRLDENSPTARLEAKRILSDEKSEATTCIPPRRNSVSSHHSSRGKRTPATIRHVEDDRMELKDGRQPHNETVTSLPHEDDDVFSPKPHSATNASLRSSNHHIGATGPPTATSQDPSFTIYPLLSVSGRTLLPPQQQAARNEYLSKPSNSLRETRSTFFGNSSFAANRSTSPYRRTLAEADYNNATTTNELPIETGPNRILFAPPIIHCSDPKEVIIGNGVLTDEAYTESVYSRTTSGRVPAVEGSQSPALLLDDFRFADSGSAVQVNRTAYQPTGPTRSVTSFSASSGRRGSLTPEVSMVERYKDTDRMVTINYTLPSMPKYFGHFREHAQITGEETEVCQRKGSMIKQPVGILQQNNVMQPVALRPILKRKSSASLDGFPMPPPLPPPLPPPMPMRSPLNRIQSRASLQSMDARSVHRTPSAPSSIIKLAPLSNHQLLSPNSLTKFDCADMHAKITKQTGRLPNNSEPSPGIVTAIERQFGSVGSRTPYAGTENYDPVDAARSGNYGSNSANHGEMRDADAQVMGSRVMVDMFLSSRRRRVAGSDESNAFI